MLASRFTSVAKYSSLSVIYNLNNLTKFASLAANSQKIRCLYSKATLGLDGFVQTRQVILNQMSNISEKFKHKMTEYSNEETNMIFTEDLKNMIHLSSNDEDIQLVIKMIKKFNQQNKQLRFGSYVFGPVVMRMFHHFNKPELAFECFKAPELNGFFDQLMSYQILLDLLFENGKYKEILEAFDIIKGRQIDGLKYPRNVVVLVLAACYKMNTKESLDYALKLWNELKDVGHYPMRRATTFCAGLAFNQGEPGIALEILTSARNQNYTTVRNLKVAAMAEVGRVENALPVLKSILGEDVAAPNKHTFNKDVIERVRSAVAKLDNPEVTLEFNRIEEQLQKEGHIIDSNLDEQLCSEIQKPPVMNNRQPQRFQSNRPQFQNKRFPMKGGYRVRERPGLDELV
ncbi:unnamed protein product [Callosobruchus maculatus]|uniref:Pentatricopeptide repeat-containing protein 2 n=1 Tax=Callosobruchus maculatus TaxID=64391 RepID=A0A653DJR4_CALMS|nr:unnamed protein product [Callosobruchus maculatus]